MPYRILRLEQLEKRVCLSNVLDGQDYMLLGTATLEPGSDPQYAQVARLTHQSQYEEIGGLRVSTPVDPAQSFSVHIECSIDGSYPEGWAIRIGPEALGASGGALGVVGTQPGEWVVGVFVDGWSSPGSGQDVPAVYERFIGDLLGTACQTAAEHGVIGYL